MQGIELKQKVIVFIGLRGKRSEFTNCQSSLELSITVPDRKGIEKKIQKAALRFSLTHVNVYGANVYGNISPNSGR